MDQALSARLGVVFWSALRLKESYLAFERGLGSGCPQTEFLCLTGLATSADGLGLSQKRRSWYSKAMRAIPRAPSHDKTLGLHFLACVSMFSMGDPLTAAELIEHGETAGSLPAGDLPIFFDGLPGCLSFWQGSFEEALRQFSVATARAVEHKHQILESLLSGLIASCHYEKGQLGQACGEWLHYFEIGGVVLVDPFVRILVPFYLQTLRGLERLEQIDEFFARLSLQDMETYPGLSLVKARYFLDQGQPEQAVVLLGERPDDLTRTSLEYNSQKRYKLWIRLWLARGEAAQFERVLRWLRVLEDGALQAGRVRDHIDAKLLRTWLYLQSDDLENATLEARESLELGRPLGFVSIYMEQPEQVRRLLTNYDKELLEAGAEWCQQESSYGV